MKKEELINHLQEFSKVRSLFHSEADFQLEFGLFLFTLGYKVRLEKGFTQIDIYQKIELDMELNGNIAIELKYKTAELTEIFDHESYLLRQHGAANLGRFDAFNDARRVKSLVNSSETKITKGFTIFLTNDQSYWANDASKTMSTEFALIDNRELKATESLNWQSESLNVNSVSKSRTGDYAPIKIDFNDKIKWFDFSEINKSKSGTFRFFVLDVNN